MYIRDRMSQKALNRSQSNIELTNLAPVAVSSQKALNRSPSDTYLTNLAPDVVISSQKALNRSQSETGLTNLAPDIVSSDALLKYARGGRSNGIRLLLNEAHRTLSRRKFSALLNALDESGRTVLHYGAWLGHQDIVTHLLFHYKDAIDVNVSGPQGFTALQLAAWKNHPTVVNLLLEHPTTDPQIGSSSGLAEIVYSLDDADYPRSENDRRQRRQQDLFQAARSVTRDGIRAREAAWKSRFLYPEKNNRRATALHWAVWAGHVGIVQVFLTKLRSSKRLKVLNAVDDNLMTPLHYAVITEDASIVEALLTSSRVRGNLEEKRKSFTPLDLAYKLIIQARGRLHVVQEYQLMISMLLERADVKASSENLYKDRQVFANAANAILVGAALIASISFAGWLQPPLGYQPDYESRYLLTGSAPPETFQVYADVRQHGSVQVFWIFNSLSFCFAIATILTVAGAVLPSQAIAGRAEVEHIRILLIRALVVLSAAIYFVLGAFIAAGFAVLPPTLEYQWGMIATATVGVSMCLIVLYYYYKRMFRLFRFENLGFRGKTKVVLQHFWSSDSGY